MDFKRDYICHYNEWWWGKTYTVIEKEGYGSVELQFDDKYPSLAFIKGLMVYESKRNEGIGSELMYLCEDLAFEHHYTYLQLSVNKEQDWLIEWYKKLGFVIIMEEDKEYIMLKQVKKEDLES